MQPRSVSPSQWQRMWVAPDKEVYKKNLAAALFADVLKKDNAQEQTANEKQEEHIEQKQSEQPTVKEDKVETKQEEKTETKQEKPSPILKQFLDLKKKHLDALLLFRCGDFYETYKDDAARASKILGITLTRSTKTKDEEGKPLHMAGFPFHALDSYLPKLIRAGERVAICDQIESPKQQAKQDQKQEEQRSSGMRR